MDTQKKEHYIIEHIVSLLNILESDNIDIDNFVAEDRQAGFSLLNSQNIQTAYEIIQFMDEMPGGFLIYHADHDEKIIYANKALLRIFQCNTLKEFRELTGNSFKGIVYFEDLEIVEDSIKEQIAESHYDLDYVEYRIVRKDGKIRWIEDYGHFLHSKSVGDVFYVFIGDATQKKRRQLVEKAAYINERKQNEQKLQSLIEEHDKKLKLINQEHLRRLEVIEGLSVNYESILYADLDTDKILPYRLSRRTERQFEQKFQSRGFLWYTSDYINTWVHPKDRDMVTEYTSPAYIRQQLENHKTFYINYRILYYGETQYLQLRIVNVGSKDHISQVVMGYRRMDEELQREIEQKQILEEALNNADLAITAKNTFLSNMSHDMRTPLNAILGYTTLAEKYCEDSKKVRDYLVKIESSSRQLLDLINKVLELSWTESTNVRLTELECNLCDIIDGIHQTLLTRADSKNITLSVNYSNLEHCDVCSDPEKLKHLFLYLADNAIMYTNNNGKVSISLRELETLPNETIVYQYIVEDTGIGISEEFLTHIFEPFERENNTTQSGIHGTGLGLPIAKSIAEMMDGDIEVSSTIGKGSIFTVTLRLHTPKQLFSLSGSKEQIFSHLMNQKILLVEDNEINLEIETEILQGLGFLIEAATNGSIAVEKIKNSKPQEFALILMDIQMPVMDGLQASRAIRQLDDPELSRIPIIALSANAFESDKRSSIESGMNAHLAKPIDIPILLETIVETLQKQ